MPRRIQNVFNSNLRSGDKVAWLSIQQVAFSKDASKQVRLMALLLTQLHNLKREDFEKRMKAVYLSESVLGPQAISWCMKVMATRCEPGPQRNFFLDQMRAAENDAANMKRVQTGWRKFGVSDPWDVVYPKKAPQLARYNSSP